MVHFEEVYLDGRPLLGRSGFERSDRLHPSVDFLLHFLKGILDLVRYLPGSYKGFLKLEHYSLKIGFLFGEE